MKTQVSLTWISSLFLALFWMPASLAQNESNPSLTSTAATPGATQPPTMAGSPTIPLSDAVAEIVKLNQARIEDGVMLAFIKNSVAFNLSPGQIIELKELGLSAPIIAAIIQHDQELAAVTKPSTAETKPDPQPVSPALSTAVASQVVLAVNERKLPEVDRTAAAPQFATSQPAVSPHTGAVDLSVVDEPRPSPTTKRSRFPVREPYPVELTAPIIMIQAAEIHPNTLVIIGFPPTAR